LEPVFTVIFAAIILGERLCALQLLGGVAIVYGGWLVLGVRRPGALEVSHSHE
jgi:drug/metabolite transporter (DMT)-like permease